MSDDGRKKPGLCRRGGSRIVDKNGKSVKENTVSKKKSTEKVKPAEKPADSEE